MENNTIKYLWYCEELGLSNDFDTEDDCLADAEKTMLEYPYINEIGIYSYDADIFPNGEVEIDDCNYNCIITR